MRYLHVHLNLFPLVILRTAGNTQSLRSYYGDLESFTCAGATLISSFVPGAPAYGSNIYARGRLAASGIYSPQKPNGKVALARIAIINVWVKYKWQLGNEKSGGFGSGAAKTTPKAILLYGVILDCNLCGIFSLF